MVTADGGSVRALVTGSAVAVVEAHRPVDVERDRAVGGHVFRRRRTEREVGLEVPP
jgi:hypothetical protein